MGADCVDAVNRALTSSCNIGNNSASSLECCSASNDIIDQCAGGNLVVAVDMYLKLDATITFPGVAQLFTLLNSCQRKFEV